ncbi:GNAT family N-acetyltransferase [Cryptosporangium sp. NPDC048952]|uniref:GNAT family N-acetyltransferase n=1 Tax=Cryptosporangium sp. NPDC048952 TaxID=3363961 RepID=UPI0037248A12
MTGPVELRHYIDPAQVTDTILEVYAEVYSDRLHEPFRTPNAYSERLSGHIKAPRWECVVGYQADEPIGFVYGAGLRPTTTWWQDIEPAPDVDLVQEDGHRTLGIFELMVRRPWRKQGLALAIHEELILHRPEQRVSLAVAHDHPRVRAMYERWGYQFVGVHRPPGPAAPLLDIMLRDLP